ncbi:hypothetical protein VSS37_10375 [Candidatus Thiothrix sp. Deng01]|uniref:Uncharacterized protein n=1 Tax=Candidatus Thiothrix phosphatis TaxID=3112415 RepID=A0ABU6CX21_9GAMM|nr:hypothetical protein [Candidatus Thiothrix sp. Deng01]MEB4591384.1 hypothetical protein [Candidatus Thiothrix sp. Deng01]
MENLSPILGLLSLLAMAVFSIGLIKPSWAKASSRGKVLLRIGLAFAVFIVALAIDPVVGKTALANPETAASTPDPKADASPDEFSEPHDGFSEKITEAFKKIGVTLSKEEKTDSSMDDCCITAFLNGSDNNIGDEITNPSITVSYNKQSGNVKAIDIEIDSFESNELKKANKIIREFIYFMLRDKSKNEVSKFIDKLYSKHNNKLSFGGVQFQYLFNDAANNRYIQVVATPEGAKVDDLDVVGQREGETEGNL